MEYKVEVLGNEYIFQLEDLISQIQNDINIIGVFESVPEGLETDANLFSINAALATRMAIKMALESLIGI